MRDLIIEKFIFERCFRVHLFPFLFNIDQRRLHIPKLFSSAVKLDCNACLLNWHICNGQWPYSLLKGMLMKIAHNTCYRKRSHTMSNVNYLIYRITWLLKSQLPG